MSSAVDRTKACPCSGVHFDSPLSTGRQRLPVLQTALQKVLISVVEEPQDLSTVPIFSFRRAMLLPTGSALLLPAGLPTSPSNRARRVASFTRAAAR